MTDPLDAFEKIHADGMHEVVYSCETVRPLEEAVEGAQKVVQRSPATLQALLTLAQERLQVCNAHIGSIHEDVTCQHRLFMYVHGNYSRPSVCFDRDKKHTLMVGT